MALIDMLQRWIDLIEEGKPTLVQIEMENVLSGKTNLQLDGLSVYVAHHAGVFLPGSSVIVAEDKSEALKRLNAELESQEIEKAGLENIREVDVFAPSVEVLFNGDY